MGHAPEAGREPGLMKTSERRAYCPSADPSMPNASLLGVHTEKDGVARLAYLDQLAPVTEELLALSSPLEPTRVFRFTAPCATGACAHFDGADCRLATRIVDRLEPAVDELPECPVRPVCRWWSQEGKAACVRCPMVATESYGATAAEQSLAEIATPS